MSVWRTRRWSSKFVVVAVVLALVLVGAAAVSAAVSLRPPSGTPDPKLMVLTSADLSGAKVTKQGYFKDQDFPSVISYEREFENGASGRTELPYVDNQAEIGTSVRTTASFLAQVRRVFSSKQGRALIRESFAGEFPTGGTVSKLQIGRPRNLGVGPGSFDLLLTLRVLGLRTHMHIAVFRVERVLGLVIGVGTPGKTVPRTTMTRLAKIMAGRMVAQLAPRNTAPPTIAGTPQVGQTLTATTGTWVGNPSGFTYQWQRCDPTGANCSDISGATAQSYPLTDADAGSTIRVVVSARNASGSAKATSAPTAPVAALGAPTNTSPPTIAGTAQVGQTLSAGTGAWTGSPTSFAFQWQRCNAGGESCVDIVGATAGTYVLAGTDQGSTVRVAVTAKNAVGQATAFSAPTAVVT